MINPVRRHYVLIVILIVAAASTFVIAGKNMSDYFGLFFLIWFIVVPVVLRISGKCQHCGTIIPQAKFFGFPKDHDPKICQVCEKNFNEPASKKK